MCGDFLPAVLVFFTALGWFFISGWRETRRYTLADGQRLYFLSVFAAIPFLWLAMVVQTHPDLAPPIQALAQVVSSSSELSEWSLDFARACLVCLIGLVGVVVSLIVLNYPYSRNRPMLRYLHHVTTDDVHAAFEADLAESELPALVSLCNDRFYVGWIIRNDRASSQVAVRLIPLFSGHREETGRLSFDVSYTESVISELGGAAGGAFDKRFQKLIPMSSIVSIGPFDLLYYENRIWADEGAGDVVVGVPQLDARWLEVGRRDRNVYLAGFSLYLVSIFSLAAPAIIWILLFFLSLAVLAISAFPAGRTETASSE